MGLAVTPKEMTKFLEDNGFEYVSQKGSHKKFSKGELTTVVSMHKEDLDKGTLKAILSESGLTRKQLEKWLGR